jgi:hypothetical protein
VLARLAGDLRPEAHVILGPYDKVELFWGDLQLHHRETRLVREHYWHVCYRPRLPLEKLQLRAANRNDVEEISDVHAEMLIGGAGIDPRLTDPDGFRRRVGAH